MIEIDLNNLTSESLKNRQKFPTFRGIYFVCPRESPLDPVYIGSAKNIRSRWRNHKVLALIENPQEYLIKTLHVSGEDLVFLEHTLISKHSPALNQVIQSGTLWAGGHYGASPHPDLLKARSNKRKP